MFIYSKTKYRRAQPFLFYLRHNNITKCLSVKFYFILLDFISFYITNFKKVVKYSLISTTTTTKKKKKKKKKIRNKCCLKSNLVVIDLLKVNSIYIGERFEMRLKITINTPE